MPKLNQINALVTGRKGETEKAVGDIYKIIQKPELFNGFTRTYKPLDEENGERLPPETQKIQQRAASLLEAATKQWTELWDLTATQDSGNQTARANIEVDGIALLAEVPVTTLLFLQKQVNDLATFVSHLPTPDATEAWDYDASQGVLRSGSSESARTKKQPARFEKSPATKEHPAQVEFYFEDVKSGTWTKTLFSGAITADKKISMLERLKKLQDAIKVAREQANMLECKRVEIAEKLIGFVLG